MSFATVRPGRRAGLACAAILSGVLLALPADGAAPQPTRDPETLSAPDRVLGRRVVLHGIRDVAVSGDTVLVLTDPGPALHLFADGTHRAWGREGGGPAEVTNPTHVLLEGGEVTVLDMEAGSVRLIRYAAGGAFLEESSVREHFVLTGLESGGGLRVARAVEFGGRQRALVRADEPADTLYAYLAPSPVEIRVDPELEGPRSLSHPPPFTATPEWTVASDGSLVYWDGAADSLASVRPDRPAGAGRPLPPGHHPVTEADRRAWIKRAFPTDFFDRPDDPLQHIRGRAREVLEFPDSLPRVLELRSDPLGGVWARRTTAAGGQRWTRVRAAEGGTTTAVFPPGRRVRAFGRRWVAATARTALDVEVVELYARDRLP